MAQTTLRHTTLTVPIAFKHDPEAAEYTAYNDDLRIAAAGNTKGEAEWRFRAALAALIAYELGRTTEQREQAGPWYPHGQSGRRLVPA